MTHEELDRRRPLWSAMSDLFLDTEVRWSVPFIALKCAESGYDDDTLERIFWGEVFPEGIGNLTQVAGEWALLTLDESALIKRVNKPSIPWLTRRATGWMVAKEWLTVREVTSWFRALPREHWEAHRKALDVLARKYLEDDVYPSALAEPQYLAPVIGEARAWWPRFREVLLRMRETSDSDEAVATSRVEKMLNDFPSP